MATGNFRELYLPFASPQGKTALIREGEGELYLPFASPQGKTAPIREGEGHGKTCPLHRDRT